MKILYGIIGALVAFAALALIVSALPIPGNYQFLVVRSGSMEPTIKQGAVVVVKPSEAYQIGDIITFRGTFRTPKGEIIPVSHRVAEIRVDQGEPFYTTKGDANDAADTREVRHREVIGKVRLTIPYIGYGIETARTTYGFLALVIIPALIIIFDQGKRAWREWKRIRQERAGGGPPPEAGPREPQS